MTEGGSPRNVLYKRTNSSSSAGGTSGDEGGGGPAQRGVQRHSSYYVRAIAPCDLNKIAIKVRSDYSEVID